VAVADALKIKQLAGMNAEAFIKALKEQIKMCDLDKIDNVKEWFSILCICHNVQSSVVRTKLLLTKDLTFQMAVDIIMEEEKAAKTAKQMADGSADPYANATSTYRADRNASNQSRQSGQGGQQNRGRSHSRGHDRTSRSNDDQCRNCGNKRHRDMNQCPARGKDCKNCQKIGHFSYVCLQGAQANQSETEPSSSRIEAEPTISNVESQHQTEPQVCRQNEASISPRIKKKREKKRKEREKGDGPTPEMDLLQQGQRVFVQHPGTSPWLPQNNQFQYHNLSQKLNQF
jgi:hypothetical protein